MPVETCALVAQYWTGIDKGARGAQARSAVSEPAFPGVGLGSPAQIAPLCVAKPNAKVSRGIGA